MQNLPPWARGLITFVIVLLLLLPLVLLAIRHPAVSTRLSALLRGPAKPVTTDRYSVQSELPGYTLKLTDTAYLDYVTENMGIFKNQAIVDPRVYYGFPDITLRYTISRVQLVLVPAVDQPVSIITAGQDRPGVFLGKGDYSVEDDTLVVRVSLDIPELTKHILARQFSLEDTYLQTAIFALRYAAGFMNRDRADKSTFEDILQDIKDYLYTGIFRWPIRIEAI